ncbi:hypothetical protein [Streptomyces tropicalis]|uniref:Integral membrane protein n=1 Tax=Streptomyces tropicalis TaxID=3034234 RepID=A0ABT6A1C5_9ACTN|nr:hypothetical protein [Streptomyces tropicalis]MDF3298176.1 hypothetical protein [Streptomyces tropicalis]
MTARTIATLARLAVLIGANKALSGAEGAPYVVTFVLGGVYVLLVNKVGGLRARTGRAQPE